MTWRRSALFDPITLSESLQNSNQLAGIGGAEYLVDLASSTPSSANIQAYTQIVLERSIVRQPIGAASDIVRKGYNPLGGTAQSCLRKPRHQVLAKTARKRGLKRLMHS